MTGTAGQNATESLSLQMRGYRLSTAEILYHMPDYPAVLQSFLWQHYDLAPEFPELHRFLDFWEENIDGPLHSVRVARCDLITPGDTRYTDAWFRIH